MSELGTKWRWQDDSVVAAREGREPFIGPWRDTKREAWDDNQGQVGYIHAQAETAEVDQARWAIQDRERG